jgi:hypothetical protein
LVEVLEKKDRDIDRLYKEADETQDIHNRALKEMSDQLKNYEAKLFQKSFEREAELSELQRELSEKRQAQANDLKDELRRNDANFERERF